MLNGFGLPDFWAKAGLTAEPSAMTVPAPADILMKFRRVVLIGVAQSLAFRTRATSGLRRIAAQAPLGAACL